VSGYGVRGDSDLRPFFVAAACSGQAGDPLLELAQLADRRGVYDDARRTRVAEHLQERGVDAGVRLDEQGGAGESSHAPQFEQLRERDRRLRGRDYDRVKVQVAEQARASVEEVRSRGGSVQTAPPGR
jgi:hypothetical protein